MIRPNYSAPFARAPSPVLREPPVHAQAHHDRRRARYRRSSAAHPKHALAGSDRCLAGRELRVTRDIGEGSETDKGCSSCGQRVSDRRVTDHSGRGRALPTTRQGVQSSNWALSCASFKVGVVASCAIAAVPSRWVSDGNAVVGGLECGRGKRLRARRNREEMPVQQ
jgi:hypothetical protein